MARDPKRVQAVFLMAAESPPDDRPALLDRECGGDSDLRHAVESLLLAHDRSGSFLDRPVDPLITQAAPGATSDPRPADFAAGSRVGLYKLTQKLGEGGMGAVWAAEQEQPVRRRVAVKLIKPGMDSAQVLRRFDAERQALALMDHPHIATILDAGVEAARGCPYFVMELVKGVPVTEYCDHLHLSVRERLELFVPVCRAVQHAHQKGIVHRDLKPSNVLVCVQDGRPAPKVIDFGVAKALHQPLTDASLHTAIGAVIGTLQYMSPEQAELSTLDVDTRADVYGLGVLLYELLTGTTPLDPTRLRQAAFTETLRVIREEEPLRPSTRLSDSGETLAALAAARKTDPAHLMKEVSGDLDWIVMKALEKDRTRRYETANGLARDVERYLCDEPVEARPPTAGYRVRKFVRRNRRGVIAAGVVTATLVLGVIGTTAGLVWALREKDAKEQARRDAVTSAERATEAATRAERRLGQMDKSNEILWTVFQDLSPGTAEKAGKSLRAILGERLDKATAQLDEGAIGDPLAVAKLQTRLGLTLSSLGYPGKAIPVLTKALRLREAELGRDDPDTLATMDRLAKAYRDADRAAEALPLIQEALARQTEKLPEGHREIIDPTYTLSGVFRGLRRNADAFDKLKEAHRLAQEHLPPDDPLAVNILTSLAVAHIEAGRPAAAQPLLVEALKYQTDIQGPTSLSTLITRAILAGSYMAANRLPEAIDEWEKTVEAMTENLTAAHPVTLTEMHNLAVAYHRAGRVPYQISQLKKVVVGRKKALGPENTDTIEAMADLANAHQKLGQHREAIDWFEEVLTHCIAKHGRTNTVTLKAMAYLGRAYVLGGDPPKAVPHLREYLAGYRKELEANPQRFANLLADTGELLLPTLPAEAEPLLREALTIREAKEPDAWTTPFTRVLIGRSLLGQLKFDAAAQSLVQGYEGMKLRKDKIPPALRKRLPEAADAVIRLYTEWGNQDKAAEWRAIRKEYPLEQLPPPRADQ
jgi:serine/threonine protein kinase/tetratricopeptide (TPR) repeat protein